jgi:hypothetical protein
MQKQGATKIMSDLDSALWKRITQIVLTENRPFSYLDFVPNFYVDGKQFNIADGTFRNKVSDMINAEKVEVICYSPQAFYTLKGVTFAKPMIDDRIGVVLPIQLKYITNDSLYRSIKNLPFGQKSLHNIRLRFEARRIWSTIISYNSEEEYKINPKSKDIRLPLMTIDNLDIHVNIHRTDTVSVIIGCSYSPIAVDVNGVIRLSSALGRVKEALCKILERYCSNTSTEDAVANAITIPDHMSWIVTMWHFGADVLADYAGEKNYRRWGFAEKILFTIYDKEWKGGKRRIRWDCQEYPGKPVVQALEEKLNANSSVVEA